MATAAPQRPGPTRLRLQVTPGRPDDFESWRFGISPIFTLDAVGREERRHFRLDGATCQFSGLAVSSVASSPAVFDRTWQVIARSGIDHFIVIAHLEGGYRLTTARGEVEVQAGDICILDLAQPSWLRTTAYTDLTLVISRAALERLVPDPDALHGFILRRGSPLNGLLLSHMRALLAKGAGLSQDEGRAATRATEELVAACVGPSAAARGLAAEAVASASLRRLRRTIEANLDDPTLGPDYLLADGGVSRSTLYRLFEPFGGVGAYIRERRLTRAIRMLTDPALRDERISAIAARCGFTSDAVFSRALRRTYGMAPGDIRANAGATGHDGDHSFRALNRWLLRLDAPGP